ncbi:hypothetical protein SBDP1_490011 [Syntrophobacter sp. SbD1]|nr:hypothetical protein SBDP1_490011 [Syntrophobacter sp. SbD1]
MPDCKLPLSVTARLDQFKSGDRDSRRRISMAILSESICLGTGFMAGSPVAAGRPGLVTRPTPLPAVSRIAGFDAPLCKRLIVALISAPFVMSGSSPPSFMTEALAILPWILLHATGTGRYTPEGSLTAMTLAGIPVTRWRSAALAAAAAAVPVLKPERRTDGRDLPFLLLDLGLSGIDIIRAQAKFTALLTALITTFGEFQQCVDNGYCNRTAAFSSQNRY